MRHILETLDTPFIASFVPINLNLRVVSNLLPWPTDKWPLPNCVFILPLHLILSPASSLTVSLCSRINQPCKYVDNSIVRLVLAHTDGIRDQFLGHHLQYLEWWLLLAVYEQRAQRGRSKRAIMLVLHKNTRSFHVRALQVHSSHQCLLIPLYKKWIIRMIFPLRTTRARVASRLQTVPPVRSALG